MYNIYPSLLDAYQDYRDRRDIWETYWGGSDSPSKSFEDYEKESFQSLIDRINRVPFESDAALRGTCLNGLIDIMLGYPSPVEHNEYSDLLWRTELRGKEFFFPKSVVSELQMYFSGCDAQVFVERNIKTMYGDVRLYGFADYVDRYGCYDLKTTGRYTRGKYQSRWQKVVYPYCLNRGRMNFEYDVVEIGKHIETYSECYIYEPERDDMKLVSILEDFICFLNENKGLITDEKIYGNSR